MENLSCDFEIINDALVSLINSANAVVEQATVLKGIVESVDLGWIDKIEGSADLYKNETLLIINDLAVNLESSNTLIKSIQQSMDLYKENEAAGVTSINNVSL